ncbi:hypothetical protein MBANPS3_010421 [Mucor bainieri]
MFEIDYIYQRSKTVVSGDLRFKKEHSACIQLIRRLTMIWFGLPLEIADMIALYWAVGTLEPGQMDLTLMNPLFQILQEERDTVKRMKFLMSIVKYVGLQASEEVWKMAGEDLNYVFIFVPNMRGLAKRYNTKHWMSSGLLADDWKGDEEISKCEWFTSKKRFFLIHTHSFIEQYRDHALNVYDMAPHNRKLRRLFHRGLNN